MTTPLPLHVKTVLITDCSNAGIGSSLAQSFASNPNLHVYATSRSLSTMTHLADLKLPNVTLLQLDVTSALSIASARSAVRERSDYKLDYLVNSAGCGYTMPYLDSDTDICRHLFDVNVWGPMQVTQALMPMLSTAELLGVPFAGAYCGSKAALRMTSESLRAEVGSLGVRVLSVTPGFVGSNWFNNVPNFKLSDESLYKPIAKQIETRVKGLNNSKNMDARVYADRVVRDILAGKQGRVYSGEKATLVAFVLAWLPQWIVDRIAIR
ncbi:oxidoreductase [Lindgomyces ingoldianus]|uniref:Oxidoreductase n=1 Tax=Lindgomyces ingoldianus TaxID=673940 RepID=A0ACB6QCD4_9PLEO|nr:oxidoreductase [Lindgomyces ingoldianus]KAF2463806.1 oxidoreductase [Lindgomyces ingoldianus]